jgi:hypothetical protein
MIVTILSWAFLPRFGRARTDIPRRPTPTPSVRTSLQVEGSEDVRITGAFSDSGGALATPVIATMVLGGILLVVIVPLIFWVVRKKTCFSGEITTMESDPENSTPKAASSKSQ